MILFKKAKDLSNFIQNGRKKGAVTGFVPTMGALHNGHLSLIGSAKKEAGVIVCSIFVNPTQFTNADDFARYPVTLEKDIDLLTGAGCDVLFLPFKEEIYPPGYHSKHYYLGPLESVLEGKFRPGHFQGVCQVVDRLLQIVSPDKLYVGAKDYQQCMVIDRLLQLTHKKDEIQLVISPTVREADGLAMSSRNLRLNAGQRQVAPALYNALTFIREGMAKMPIEQLRNSAMATLQQKGFKVDYLEVADAQSLAPSDGHPATQVALVAAYLNEVRLMDNLVLS